MRNVYYCTKKSGYTADTLSQLREHLEFFTRILHRKDYDGDYVQRFIYQSGEWTCDDGFLAQIEAAGGKIIFHRLTHGDKSRYAATVKNTPREARKM